MVFHRHVCTPIFRVTAHFVPLNDTTKAVDGSSDTAPAASVENTSVQGPSRNKVTLLIKFSPHVMERERMLSTPENN